MKVKWQLYFFYVASFIMVFHIYTIVVYAADYPVKPIRWIVLTGPGGGVDIAARIIASKLSEGLGQPVVIDNRAGASGAIGIGLMVNSPPDGYTLVASTQSMTINAVAHGDILPYDVEKDLTPVTMLAVSPYILVVHPSLPVKSVKELVQYAKARPGKLNFSSSGSGTSSHIGIELLKMIAGIDMVHIPYKGGPPAITANLSGEVMLSFFAPVALGSYVKDGRLRALAAGSAKRTPSMPDLPTFAEAGFPGVEVTPWYGVHASAKTPKSIIERLHREFVKVLRIPDVKDMLMKQGLEIVANTPGEFSAIIKEEIARWTKLFKEAKIEIE